VRTGAFPGEEHTYAIPDDELERFLRAAQDHDHEREQDRGEHHR
jgi:hypothetical protein